MADQPLLKPDGIARQWSGYGDLTENLALLREAAERIVRTDDRAAGRDSYGDQYRQTRGSAVTDVLGLITGAQQRTSDTEEAGHNSAALLDQAEEDNRRHTGFTPEHQ